jgi:thioredoxin 1
MGEPANLIHFKGSEADLTSLVKQTSGLVLIDFYADWCGPCQQFGRQLPGIAGQYPSVKFVKVNIEDNKEVAGAYKVRSIPHILFAKGVGADGAVQQVETIVGLNLAAIKAAIEKNQ